MRQNIYTVTEVNRYIHQMFSQDFMMNHIQVSGEVINCKYHTSGHIYFTLKDQSGVISAIMYRNQAAKLSLHMKEGQKVVVSGRIGVYEMAGKYQLYADSIELAGAGDLYLRFEQLKKELEEMGMFSPEYKKPIPKYARKIGVVTAPTGAAIRDIQNISARRNPYVQMILCPALVQGEGAASSICQGIRALEMIGVDIIIVGRGGGSMEDLWAFNEEIVARAIFDCQVPVISAVGHETDVTIADFVADMRAPTPSAAAELAVFSIQTFYEDMEHYRQLIRRECRHCIDDKRQRYSYYASQLSILDPKNQIQNRKQYVLELEEKLRQTMEMQLTIRKHRFELLLEQLEGLSPAKKLMQGYSVVLNNNNKSITSINDVKADEIIHVQVMDGTIEAKVRDKKETIRWEKK